MSNKRRIVWSVLLVAALSFFSMAWNTVAPVYEVDAALGQMENSDEAYTIGRGIASWDPTFWVGVLTVLLLLSLWAPVVVAALKLKLSEETQENA